MELLHCKAAHLGSLEQLRKLVRCSDAEFGICADVSLMTPDEMELSLQDAKTRSYRLADGPGGHLSFGEGQRPMRDVCGRLAERGLLKNSIIALNNRKYVLDPGRAVTQTAQQIE